MALSSSASQLAHTNFPFKNLASGLTAQTVKSPESAAIFVRSVCLLHVVESSTYVDQVEADYQRLVISYSLPYQSRQGGYSKRISLDSRSEHSQRALRLRVSRYDSLSTQAYVEDGLIRC
jgi:hypothetical protein